jgi:hypothetical protein
MDREVEDFIGLFEQVRTNVKESLRKMGDDGVNWSLGVDDTNTAAVLVTHMFGSQSLNVHEHLGDIPVKRDRDSEFTRPLQTVDELSQLVDRITDRTIEVLSNETSESLGRNVPGTGSGPSSTARRKLTTTLMHHSEHLGHLQLTEQLRQSAAI